jgi:sugar phosphate isomerase/epimerase
MPQNRRHFLQQSAALSSGLWLSAMEKSFRAAPAFRSSPNFQVLLLATNWGFDGNVDTFCSKVKSEGYDGIEIWWPLENKEQNELFKALQKYDLKVGFLCGAYQKEFHEHFSLFKRMVYEAATNTRQKPLYINCHSGRDYYSTEQNGSFIDYTIQLSRQTGILICHETHRSRILFAAPIASQYFQNFPELKITFDVSHWCTVSESFLTDQEETLTKALERTEHIHARIGHPEGPQVNDPRAPEWEKAVSTHLQWWDKIVERKKKEGGRLTFLTEFGPPDYMPTLPYTRQPLADQWTINVNMMHLLRKRYSTI